MLQKRNDYEIVESLRYNPQHIRQLASELQMVASTVMRTMRVLEKENVVDFIQSGKNKVYSLKDTPEAKTYVFITEHYKLLKLLQNPEMRRVCKKIWEHTHGELIVLFGSHAKGISTSQSDIDVFVETNDNKLRIVLKSLSEKLSIKIGKLEKDNLLTKEIIKHHVIIQNVEEFYRAIQ